MLLLACSVADFSQIECIVAQSYLEGCPFADISIVAPLSAAPVPDSRSTLSKEGPAIAAQCHGVTRLLANMTTCEIQNLGTFVAAGPVATAFRGTGNCGVATCFVRLGADEGVAARCEEQVMAGQSVLAIQIESPEKIESLLKVFENNAAQSLTATSAADARLPVHTIED